MKKLVSLLVLVLLLASCSPKNESTDSFESEKISVNEIQKKRNGEDPFLEEKYWEINKSPMQERLRNIKPYPVGVVYYQQRDEAFKEAKKEFQVIKDLGFTALKQVQIKAPYNGPDFKDSVFNAALDVGISPWYYGKGGWQKITQRLVDSLGINMKVNDKSMPEIQKHPKMVDYQTNQVMRPRIKKDDKKRKQLKKFLEAKGQEKGEPGRNNPWLPERLIGTFANWLQDNYKTIDSLKWAWNDGFVDDLEFTSFYEAAKLMKGTGFDKFGNGWGKTYHEFRRFRDAMRFQADLIVENYELMMKWLTEWDPNEPERTGGHQIFENQAANTWDLEGQARSASVGGSFYASIHLAHHFFLVDDELTRPTYMQSRTVSDMFKGGWSATWESTGGPTFFSGYAPAPVDGGKMRQLMCSYIASGLKGIGLWMWNSRGEGWEMGEYAMCDVQGKPSERAIQGGRISELLQEYRFELWETMDEPAVGVLYSWETEAMMGRMSLGAYPLETYVYNENWARNFRQYHSEAKIGISRALINNNIPYEYVTERNIAEGLIDRYPIMYLPYTTTLTENNKDIIETYVKNGGKLVADCPVFMIDEFGRLNKQRKGSRFEKMFGFMTADYYHTRTMEKKIDGEPVDNSLFGDLKVTNAKVIKNFDDGTPAILKNNYGKGSVVYFNFEAGRTVFKPGNKDMENLLTSFTLGNYRPQYFVENAGESMVFRRAGKEADHYFVINDGKEQVVEIISPDYNYSKAVELIDNARLKLSNNSFKVKVPEHSAVWIRAKKE